MTEWDTCVAVRSRRTEYIDDSHALLFIILSYSDTEEHATRCADVIVKWTLEGRTAQGEPP